MWIRSYPDPSFSAVYYLHRDVNQVLTSGNASTIARSLRMQAIGQPVVGDRRADNSNAGQRSDLQRQAAAHEAAAEAAALVGDVETSARLILQALDCERRAGGVGPQVLQLIKPRP